MCDPATILFTPALQGRVCTSRACMHCMSHVLLKCISSQMCSSFMLCYAAYCQATILQLCASASIAAGDCHQLIVHASVQAVFALQADVQPWAARFWALASKEPPQHPSDIPNNTELSADGRTALINLPDDVCATLFMLHPLIISKHVTLTQALQARLPIEDAVDPLFACAAACCAKAHQSRGQLVVPLDISAEDLERIAQALPHMQGIRGIELDGGKGSRSNGGIAASLRSCAKVAEAAAQYSDGSVRLHTITLRLNESDFDDDESMVWLRKLLATCGAGLKSLSIDFGNGPRSKAAPTAQEHVAAGFGKLNSLQNLCVERPGALFDKVAERAGTDVLVPTFAGLRRLLLVRCNLTDLKEGLCAADHLTSCTLHACDAQSVSYVLPKLTQLKSLTLQKVDGEEFAGLAGATQLTELSVSHVRKARDNADRMAAWRKFAQADFAKLQHLSLQDCWIGPDSFPPLAAALCCMPALRTLDLANQRYRDDKEEFLCTGVPVHKLAHVLPYMAGLRELRLDGNDFHEVRREPAAVSYIYGS